MMNYNLLIGGAAGQGMETLSSLLSTILQRKGYELFTLQDYMSRVRGGHNFFQVRFSDEVLDSHSEELDGIIALNQETVDLHISRLKPEGFIIGDDDIKVDDPRLITIPTKKIATELGNPKVASAVQLGAVLKLFDIDSEYLDTLLKERFNEKVVVQNLEAFDKGHELVEPKYEKVTVSPKSKILLQGNDAIALGALAAGMKFYSAYPMTPSTSIMSYLVTVASKAKVVVEQAEDEIAAINMAIGASYAGVRAMTGTAGGGFSLMVEALGMAGITETPLVIAIIQRPGPATGLPTRTEQSDLKFVINASHGEFPRMVIALRNPKDAFYQTVRAFDLADKYQIPVMILGDQYLADCTRTMDAFDIDSIVIDRHMSDGEEYRAGKEYKRYELTESGISNRIIPGKIPGTAVNSDTDEHDEYGNITEASDIRMSMVEKRARKFELLKKEIQEPDLVGEEDMDVLLVAWGSLDSPVKEAIRFLNEEGKEKYGALIFGDIWPFPTARLVEKMKSAKKVINVEQNYNGQLADLIREGTGLSVTGSVLKYDGRPLSGKSIAKAVKEAQ